MSEPDQINVILEDLRSPQPSRRKKALINLITVIETAADLKPIFDRVHLALSKCLCDHSETCREQAIKVFDKLVQRLDVNDYYLTYILPTLTRRLIDDETVEEIRLVALEFLDRVILMYRDDRLLPFFDMIRESLSTCLTDTYPEIKIKTCIVLINLTKSLPKTFHMHAATILQRVLPLVNHPRNQRVRAIAIACVKHVVACGRLKEIPNEVFANITLAMADETFPNVALEGVKAASVWGLDLPDRYSYFHRIIPMFFVGLKHEDELAVKTKIFWREVGEKYLNENVERYKDELDFGEVNFRQFGDYRPTFGCRKLVINHASKILTMLNAQITDWKVEIKQESIKILYMLILHGESEIEQQLPDILAILTKAISDSNVSEIAALTGRVIGHFSPPSHYLDIIFPLLDISPTQSNQIALLSLLAAILNGVTCERLNDHVERICQRLADDDICKSERNARPLIAICECLVKCSSWKDSSKSGQLLFTIITSIRAMSDIDDGKSLMDDFFDGVDHVIITEYKNAVLFGLTRTVKQWTPAHADVKIFIAMIDLELLDCDEMVILQILRDIPGDWPDLKLSILLALSQMMLKMDDASSIPKNCQNFFTELINEILLPNLIWHAGRTYEATRGAALACTCAVLPMCDCAKLNDTFMSIVLGLAEEQAMKTRELAVRAIGWLVSEKRDVLTVEDIKLIYPVFLKRLDDNCDAVRLEAAKSMPNLWKCNNFSDFNSHGVFSAHFDTICTTLMIHLDDDDRIFRDLIRENLSGLGTIDREHLLSKVKVNKVKFRNQREIDLLVEALEVM